MSYTRINNKRPVENFLVAIGNQAMEAGGTPLKTLATGVVPLVDGQLGVYSADYDGAIAYDVTLTAAETIADATSIRIIQGTPISVTAPTAQPNGPLYVRPYIATKPIEGNFDISMTKQEYIAPTWNTWAIGDTGVLATGGIVAADDTEYQLSIAYRGDHMDEMYSQSGSPSFNPSFVTPNYTALSTAEPVDHLIENLVFVINRNSRDVVQSHSRFQADHPVVGFALNLAGTGGTAVAGLASGTVIPVVTDSGGTVRNYTVENAAQATAMIAALPSGSSIINANLATAGTTTGGVADAIGIMALDRTLAFDDKRPNVKINLNVGLRKGFDYLTIQHGITGFGNEGENSGRQLRLQWERTEGQRLYSLQHTMDPIINFDNPVVEATTYFKYTIEHKTIRQVDTFNAIANPMKEYILIPTAGTTTVTQFEALMNPWLVSAGTVGV